MSETAADKVREGGKGKLHASEPFPPAAAVRTEDGGNGIFINERMSSEDMPVTGSILITLGNRSLDRERDLGIRYNGRKEQSMGMAAGLTEDPCYAEKKDRIPLSKPAGITSVPDEASEMAAGTGKEC